MWLLVSLTSSSLSSSPTGRGIAQSRKNTRGFCASYAKVVTLLKPPDMTSLDLSPRVSRCQLGDPGSTSTLGVLSWNWFDWIQLLKNTTVLQHGRLDVRWPKWNPSSWVCYSLQLHLYSLFTLRCHLHLSEHAYPWVWGVVLNPEAGTNSGQAELWNGAFHRLWSSFEVKSAVTTEISPPISDSGTEPLVR